MKQKLDTDRIRELRQLSSTDPGATYDELLDIGAETIVSVFRSGNGVANQPTSRVALAETLALAAHTASDPTVIQNLLQLFDQSAVLIPGTVDLDCLRTVEMLAGTRPDLVSPLLPQINRIIAGEESTDSARRCALRTVISLSKADCVDTAGEQTFETLLARNDETTGTEYELTVTALGSVIKTHSLPSEWVDEFVASLDTVTKESSRRDGTTVRAEFRILESVASRYPETLEPYVDTLKATAKQASDAVTEQRARRTLSLLENLTISAENNGGTQATADQEVAETQAAIDDGSQRGYDELGQTTTESLCAVLQVYDSALQGTIDLPQHQGNTETEAGRTDSIADLCEQLLRDSPSQFDSALREGLFWQAIDESVRLSADGRSERVTDLTVLSGIGTSTAQRIETQLSNRVEKPVTARDVQKADPADIEVKNIDRESYHDIMSGRVYQTVESVVRAYLDDPTVLEATGDNKFIDALIAVVTTAARVNLQATIQAIDGVVGATLRTIDSATDSATGDRLCRLLDCLEAFGDADAELVAHVRHGVWSGTEPRSRTWECVGRASRYKNALQQQRWAIAILAHVTRMDPVESQLDHGTGSKPRVDLLTKVLISGFANINQADVYAILEQEPAGDEIRQQLNPDSIAETDPLRERIHQHFDLVDDSF